MSKDDAAYPPSKHARLTKDQLSHGMTPKAGSKGMAARGGPTGRGGTRGHGTRGKAKMLADESRFSRPHPLQVALHLLRASGYTPIMKHWVLDASMLPEVGWRNKAGCADILCCMWHLIASAGSYSLGEEEDKKKKKRRRCPVYTVYHRFGTQCTDCVTR